ncbi:PepSY-associated TM helix domain-containing protein [Archangium sp.]|uniref:PepSY-associated TM helix domain-containing protein n=1 Tax=Archangium sp. TaxID=1872627 RepID=UPI002D779153|nr:PepSY-associated TM helix domain-containing protein [Archangium sp.]
MTARGSTPRLLGWTLRWSQLLSGETGEAVVGASGCVLIVLGLSGLVLWWPGRRKLGAGFTLRRPLLWRRANYDLRKLGDVFSLVFLLLAALSADRVPCMMPGADRSIASSNR